MQVGAAKKFFFLHKGILSFYSGYFRAALSDDFLEAVQGFIDLPTEDVSLFERFVGWLYNKNIDLPKEVPDAFQLICSLWAFADRRQVPLLMNAMVNALRDTVVSSWISPDAQVSYIYEHSTGASGMRRAAVEIISSTAISGLDDESNRQQWPKEAVWDVLKAIVAKRNSKRCVTFASKNDVAKLDMCQFHCHEEGVKCSEASK